MSGKMFTRVVDPKVYMLPAHRMADPARPVAQTRISPLKTMLTAIALLVATSAARDAAASIVTTTGGACVNTAGTVGRVLSRSTPEPVDGSGTYSLVAGCGANGGGQLAVTALGDTTQTTGAGATAIGWMAGASKWAIAAGLESVASGTGSTALGFGSNATGLNALAIGGAGGDGTTALSVAASTTASGAGSVALGGNSVGGAHAIGNDSIAIGGQSNASTTDTIAVGRNAQATAAGALSLGSANSAANAQAIAVGSAASASGTGALSVGNQSVASATNAIGIGTQANASGADGIAAGRGATAAVSAVAVGQGATASQSSAVSLGNGSAASGVGSAALGQGAQASVQDAVAVGHLAVAAQAGAVALGVNAVTAAAVDTPSTSIAGTTYTFAGATPLSTVSIGAPGSVRTLTNLAAGRIAASSTDGINGSQLFAAQSAITTVDTRVTTTAAALADVDTRVDTLGVDTAVRLGGGASYDPATGALAAPTYVVGGTTFNTVGDALGNVDGRLVQNTSDIDALANGVGNGTVGLVRQDPATRVLSVGASVDGASVDFTGTTGARVLQGVAAGAVNAGSQQAVNGSQLFGVGQSVSSALGGGSTVNADGSVSAPTYAVGGTTVGNVADAFGNVDGRVTQNSGDIADLASSIGNGSTGLVRQDAGSRALSVGATTDGTSVDFTGTSGARGLLGVAAGAVGAGSLDAINGSQLFGVSQSLSGALGGGSIVNPDGSVTAPAYAVGGTTFASVGSALGNVDGRVTQNAADIDALSDGIGNGSVGLVRQDAVTRALTIGATTDGTSVDITGTAGERVLQGVAAGVVGAGSQQAVNGGQLFGVSQSISSALGGGATVNPDGSVSAPSYTAGGAAFSNVGDAISNVDGRVTQNSSDISSLADGIANGSTGLVRQDPATSAITVASDSAGTTVDFAGTAGARLLRGLAPGPSQRVLRTL